MGDDAAPQGATDGTRTQLALWCALMLAALVFTKLALLLAWPLLHHRAGSAA